MSHLEKEDVEITLVPAAINCSIFYLRVRRRWKDNRGQDREWDHRTPLTQHDIPALIHKLQEFHKEFLTSRKPPKPTTGSGYPTTDSQSGVEAKSFVEENGWNNDCG